MVSNENRIINKLSILFDNTKYQFTLIKDPLVALKKIKTKKYDLVIINSIFPQYLLKEFLKKVKLADSYIFTILISEHNDLDLTLNFIKDFDIQGYYDTSNDFKNLIVLVELIINSIYEFTRILGILLDNAIEAASECENKIIHVSFRKEQNRRRLLVIIDNTYKKLLI